MIIALLFALNFAHAADAPIAVEETGLRTKSDPHFFVGASGALIGAASWGVSTGGGLGAEGGFNTRFQYGRFGLIFDWKHQSIDYYDPAVSQSEIWGVGPTFKVIDIARSSKFWRGTHVSVNAKVEWGKNHYSVYEHKTGSTISEGGLRREFAKGSSYGTGFSVGGDFNFPLWLGFWANAGTGYERIKFKYRVPSGERVHATGNPSENLSFHIGVSYSI